MKKTMSAFSVIVFVLSFCVVSFGQARKPIPTVNTTGTNQSAATSNPTTNTTANTRKTVTGKINGGTITMDVDMPSGSTGGAQPSEDLKAFRERLLKEARGAGSSAAKSAVNDPKGEVMKTLRAEEKARDAAIKKAVDDEATVRQNVDNDHKKGIADNKSAIESEAKTRASEISRVDGKTGYTLFLSIVAIIAAIIAVIYTATRARGQRAGAGTVVGQGTQAGANPHNPLQGINAAQPGQQQSPVQQQQQPPVQQQAGNQPNPQQQQPPVQQQLPPVQAQAVIANPAGTAGGRNTGQGQPAQPPVQQQPQVVAAAAAGRNTGQGQPAQQPPVQPIQPPANTP